MIYKNAKHVVAMLAISLIWACGGDSGSSVPESTTSLTSSEQGAVGGSAKESGSTDGSPTALQRQISALKGKLGTIAITEEFSETENCELGGEIAMTGSFEFDEPDNQNFEDFSAKFDQTADYKDCQISDPDSGNTLTLNGELVGKGTFEFGTETGSIDFDIKGGLDVAGAQEGDGTCGIDISFSQDFSFDSAGDAEQATGEVCGQAFTEQL